ncbi:O-antigen ligase family protein [Antribacter sp. KLBMP9083]|uniref:O-antigen ligase family protein n=1 Tax=Antribacter soli TaxID=2910976 RepID=A0AA41QB32_9MICO|nr:O-antigen ligase family protein [Antribacter soli]MCF4119993.1 O-antigen ligase family protein [Antribacter soli]
MTTAARPLSLRLRTERGFRLDAVFWLSVYLVVLFAVPAKQVLAPLGSAGAPSMVFGLGSFLLWLLLGVGTSRPGPLQVHPVRTALGLFAFSVGLTYIIVMARPINGDEVSPADVALLSLLAWSGTLLVAHDGIPSRARFDTLVRRMALCGGVLAALGLAQVVSGQAFVDRFTIPGLTGTGDLGLTWRGGLFRPAGTAAHPLEYGVLVMMLLPIALHVALHHKERSPRVRWTPAVLLVLLIPLTGSRSAYIGAAIGAGIVMIGWPAKRRAVVAILGGVGVLAAFAAAPNVADSILGLFTDVSDDPSITSRTDSFGLAEEFIARNPLFGRGLGTFLPKYRIFDNQYLLLLVTIGIVGTALFLAVWLVTVGSLLRVRALSSDERTRDLALALVASVTVGFVSLSFFDAFAFPMTMGALFLVLGMAGALRKLESTWEPVFVPQGGLSTHRGGW